MTNQPKLSVIVPMYNEENVVDSTIKKIREELRDLPEWELLLINDGSTDNTLQKVYKASADIANISIHSYAVNRGRGKALREGFKLATGEIIVTIECDLSYDSSNIKNLYNELVNNPEYDIILGSAYMSGGGAINLPSHRLALSRWGNKMLSFALNSKLHTFTSMLRGYRHRAINSLSLDSDGKEIHLEIISKALAIGLLIKEIPAILKGRELGKSKFRLTNTIGSHLFFSISERPMIIFGLLGILLLIAGLVSSIYLIILWQQAKLNPDRPLIILTAILIVTGLQALFFGFVAIQQLHIRKEIFKMQSKIKKDKSNHDTDRQ